MKNAFLPVGPAAELIASGATLFISGPEALLRVLPRGNWIGGTTAYFMTEGGGVSREDRLFCTTFHEAIGVRTAILPADQLSDLTAHRFQHGFTCIVAPAFSSTLQRYAIEGPGLPGLYNQPVFGWVAGVRLDRAGTETPKVFDGATGMISEDGLAALWIELPENLDVDLDIVNLFTTGDGDEITFPEAGFEVTDCLIGDAPANFARYVVENDLDTNLPLVADYAGAMINVSFQTVDVENGRVRLYAPVVPGTIYRLARAVSDYALAYEKAANVGSAADMLSCNCILNYRYAGLEGHPTGGFVGPVTFGEFAYILLNQTLVRLSVPALSPAQGVSGIQG
ncbi:MAG: hypothetical protein WC729_09255 [Sphingomonas sp.]|jgi:hypothetical protein|uniref:DUF6976 family protein n=1 Tax=Sphingomonas sp. TaxID=28214 RepID=UPI00356B4870